MARATTKRKTAKAAKRPRLFRTLVSTTLLMISGFAVGLLVGAFWQGVEPWPNPKGEGEEIILVDLSDPTGDTTPPADEQDVGVPDRPPVVAQAAGDPLPPVAAPPPDKGPFAIQVGSFTEPVPAWKLAEQLGEKDYPVYVDEGAAAGQPRWRVRVGPFPNRRTARGVADRLKAQEALPTWILADGTPG